MGIGPIKMTPPVCISVFESLDEDCRAVPININKIPIITTTNPIKIIES